MCAIADVIQTAMKRTWHLLSLSLNLPLSRTALRAFVYFLHLRFEKPPKHTTTMQITKRERERERSPLHLLAVSLNSSKTP